VVIDKRSKGETNVQGSSSDDGNISLIIISRHKTFFILKGLLIWCATFLFLTIINP
jgi:hypothetical protein